MSHVTLIQSATTNAQRQALLAPIQQAFGSTPNMFSAVANSPAALSSMWAAFGALGKGVLGPQLGEQIAVAIAQSNACEYCLAAHTLLGKNAGLSEAEMTAAQAGQSTDPKTAAALTFALKVVKQRAQVNEQDFVQLRSAGFEDEHIVEILAHVALNIFTNYINIALNVPLDFPAVALNPV